MRILSTFHDYYDGVARSWDPTGEVCTYIRTPTDVPVGKPFTTTPKGVSIHQTIDIQPGVIGFCGKLYPYINYHSTPMPGTDREPEYCYSMDALLKHVSFNAKGDLDLSNYSTNRRPWAYLTSNRRFFESWFTGSYINGWHTDTVNIASIYLPLFLKHRVPIFNYGPTHEHRNPTTLQLNPCLADFQFYRAVDATQTVQQLEIYLTNDLAPRDEVSMNISDKLRAHSHGFDKYSFRKPKQ